MAPKRRASDDALPPSKERRSGGDRSERLGAALSGLNEHFASWVASNKDSSIHLLWADGVRDYVQHASKLLDEHKDAAVPAEGIAALQQAASDALSQVRLPESQSDACKDMGSGKEQRARDFVRKVAGLNRAFARWVASAQLTYPRMWWTEAARDYLKQSHQLLEDFADLLASSAAPREDGPKRAAADGRTGADTARPVGPAPVTSGFGGFGSFGSAPAAGPGGGGGGGFFGGLASQPPAGGPKGSAPVTGFMAAAASTGGAPATASAAAPATAPSSTSTTMASAAAAPPAAAAGSSFFGSRDGAAAPSTAVFGFSFAPPAEDAPASAAPAEAAAPASSKDAAAAPEEPKALSFGAPSASITATAAAKEIPAGPAADSADKLAAPEPAAAAITTMTAPATAPSSSAGLFKFGLPSTSLASSAAAAAAAPSSSGLFGLSGSGDGAAAAHKPFVSDASAASSSAAGDVSTKTPALFTFGAPSSTAATAPSSSSAAGSLAGSIFGSSGGGAGTAPAFSFGAAAAGAAGGTAAGSAADAAKKNGNAADGGKAAPSAAVGSTAAPGGFLFGGASGAGGGFSFGSSTPTFIVAPKPAATDAEGEETEPEPEPDECTKEPSLKVDDNVDFLFREKARLQLPVKGPDGKVASWEAKGLGTLSIRRARAEGAKPYIALFTDVGRCLFQAYLYKTMKVVVSDKQKSVAFSAVWSPDGTSPPAMNPALFQLAAGKNRVFEKVVQELQAEMAE